VHTTRPMSSYTDLVIVCGHAIFLGDPNSPSCDVYALDQWLLKPFQRPTEHKPGEHETFIQHIRAGLDNLLHGFSKDSCLVAFSGGPTEPDATPLSEAQSYMNVATALSNSNPLGQPCVDCLKTRILLEEKATDSYQNLLFSIVLFRRATGRYPDRIRVVTDAFKTYRFLSLHAEAIRWPKERILIQGIDPVMPEHEYTKTVAGESAQGQDLWKLDWYGTKEKLTAKRLQRGWNDSISEELGEGLEDGVKDLL
ncbi:hypothetical protein K490DRAFT_17186, partial [Saccharata proteae CBS 121410]